MDAAARDMALPKLTRLTRTICRLARMIMSIDVYLYQSKVKAEMLADIDWKARVIDELGGYPALRLWQARFDVGPMDSRTKPFVPRERAAAPRKPTARQFRLAPLPRATFAGERRSEARNDFAPSAPPISGFDRPIPLEPWELWPAIVRRRAGGPPCYSKAEYARYYQTCSAEAAGERFPP